MDIQVSVDVSALHGATQGRYSIHIVKSLDTFRMFRLEWEQLESASEVHSFCLTYRYCELAAERSLAAGELVVVAKVYDDARLLAIWPFAVKRAGMLRVANVLTCGNHEEYGGPLFRGIPTMSVAAECVRAAMRIPADVFEIPFLQEGSVLQEALESAPQSWVLRLLPQRLRSFPGYSVTLRDFVQWDQYSRTRSQSLRRNLRRYRKGLDSIGHTEFGWCTTLEDAVAVLNWLFENKRRWALARGLNTKYLMEDKVRDFFTTLAAQTDLSSVPLVAFVKVNGVPICASINLVGPSTLEYWIFTYDEAYNRYSVGNQLTEFVAHWAHANGRDFDMRLMYNEYKTYWVNRETRHQTRVVVLGWRGRLREIPLFIFQITRVRRRLARELVAVFASARTRLARYLSPAGFRKTSNDT
jgi:CelD/BcsL family acetyltransferase involved in cellulose biosynthesis